jgi:cytochrome c-type biogenesis protein CcmE
MEPAHAHDRIAAKLVVAAAGLALGVCVGRAAVHRTPYLMVDALARNAFAYLGREVRVNGFVQDDPGHAADNVDRTLVLGRNGARIRVHYRGVLPDTVREHSDAVMRGRLVIDDKGWMIEATELSVRCAINYRGAASNKLDTQYK